MKKLLFLAPLLLVLLFCLRWVSSIFNYFALAFLIINLGIVMFFLIKNFLNVKSKMLRTYLTFLAEKYNEGLATKQQVEEGDMSLFKEYYKNTFVERMVRIGFMVLCASFMITAFVGFFYI